MIPLNDIVVGKKDITNVVDALAYNDLTGVYRNYIIPLEDTVSKYCNRDYGIAVSSGTAALHLALLSLNIKKGDEVIVPTLTMAATVFAILYTGANPVLVDIDKDTWNIDTNLIEEKITNKTKAIIPVHLYGNPCDMDKINSLANKYHLKVIEDCAEALGAGYKNNPVGSLGDISCHSFYATKMMTTGEGGMVLTNDQLIAKRISSLRNMAFGIENRYKHQEIGYNYRMSNIHAAIGCAQIQLINKVTRLKRSAHNEYKKYINNIKFQEESKDGFSCRWMHGVISDNYKNIRNHLADNHIAKTGDIFVPMHKQTFYKFKGNYPVADEIYEKGFLLPSSLLLSSKELKYISDSINEVQ